MEHQKLAEPDAHLDRLLVVADLEEPWYKSIARSVRERLNPPNLPPLELTSRPVSDAELGDIQAIEQPWFKSFINNIRDTINPPKLPPLEVTSKPVAVKDIWGAYHGGETRSGLVSLVIHVSVIALLFLIFRHQILPEKKKDDATLIYPLQPYKPKLPPASSKPQGGGGGGMHQPKPVDRGAAPKFNPKPFIPPTIAVEKPKLPAMPTISAVAPQITADNYGDPLSKAMEQSGGQGANGLGSGKGSGLGSGSGNGYGPGEGGGTGGGVYRPGGDVSAPAILSQVEPEYSEEARKAKYSGTVTLSLVVDEHGMPTNIRVIKPLGLGLDEKAIEAVRQWRFRPGMKGGKPVKVSATVEVLFRLL